MPGSAANLLVDVPVDGNEIHAVSAVEQLLEMSAVLGEGDHVGIGVVGHDPARRVEHPLVGHSAVVTRLRRDAVVGPQDVEDSGEVERLGGLSKRGPAGLLEGLPLLGYESVPDRGVKERLHVT